MKKNNINCDVLIIGSGIAGLRYALDIDEKYKVVLITKSDLERTNTYLAQGGVASVFAENDSFDKHTYDTLKAGFNLNDKAVVQRIIEGGPKQIKRLIDEGAHFNMENGRLALTKEGGHSERRIVFRKDYTGKEIEESLIRTLRKRPNIEIRERCFAIDLIREKHLENSEGKRQGSCFGAYALDMASETVVSFTARITMIATGGLGMVYEHTTNTDESTSDGIAMAYRAYAKIGNMEFVQFHPTSFYAGGEKAFLISEAVRGEGGILRTIDGKAFMKNYSDLGNLAPRDVTARAIDHEMKKSGSKHVYLDVTHLSKSFLKKRFPVIYGNCEKYGLDISVDFIPVVPAAHYTVGGIAVNLNGATNIKNLLASGEAAFTGFHGANRLASNSLLEALVISASAAVHTNKVLAKEKKKLPAIQKWQDEGIFDHKEWVVVSHNKDIIRKIMWEYVGIVRSDKRLFNAHERIRAIRNEIEDFYHQNPVRPEVLEVRNIAQAADMIVESAINRKESRGLHFNADYPCCNDRDYLANTFIQKRKKTPKLFT